MRQDFGTAELKAALEGALGFRLRELVRLDGASALNFRAVRASDGLTFAVKCSPKSRQTLFDHLVAHLAETAGTKAVRRLFAETCPATFRGYNVICLSWCAGERLFPDRLSPAQLDAFLDDYRAFSAAMQRATGIVRADPLLDWREGARKACRGFWGAPLARLIAREIPPETVTYRPERLKVIHGDFHHGNFLFVDGAVNGFFDLEEFCHGYPADDLTRYFVCAAEHLRGLGLLRLPRLLARFRQAVRRFGGPKDEWILAVNALLVRKIFFKTRDGAGPSVTLNLLWRARLYRKLRRIVGEALP